MVAARCAWAFALARVGSKNEDCADDQQKRRDPEQRDQSPIAATWIWEFAGLFDHFYLQRLNLSHERS